MTKYEATNCDTGRTVIMTQAEAEEFFGKDELQEYIDGYAPHWVVMAIEE